MEVAGAHVALDEIHVLDRRDRIVTQDALGAAVPRDVVEPTGTGLQHRWGQP
jgi:hypothetical protein